MIHLDVLILLKLFRDLTMQSTEVVEKNKF